MTSGNGLFLPSAEACDDKDNDCNGLTDEGCSCDEGTSHQCYPGPPTTQGIGECKDGTQSCVGGVWSSSCDGSVLPTADAAGTLLIEDSTLTRLIGSRLDVVLHVGQILFVQPGGDPAPEGFSCHH